MIYMMNKKFKRLAGYRLIHLFSLVEFLLAGRAVMADFITNRAAPNLPFDIFHLNPSYFSHYYTLFFKNTHLLGAYLYTSSCSRNPGMTNFF